MSVHRAICSDEGTEVLWYQIALDKSPVDLLRSRGIDVTSLTRVSHPHLLILRDVWYDSSTSIFHYITEFPPPQTLRAYISDVVRDPPRAVVARWCYHVLGALEALHSQSPPIIHRNLSCDNIFIDASEGLVKVGLPGLRMAIDGIPNPLAGPRELSGWSTETRSDIWLFGLCVVEMSTGSPPYDGLSATEIRQKIDSHEMPKAFADVPDPLVADLIMTCLSFNGLQPTAAQLKEDPIFGECHSARSLTPPSSLNVEQTVDGLTPPSQIKVPGSVRDDPRFRELVRKQEAEREELLQKHEEEKRTYVEQRRRV
jgi:WNK lysine deficient protein kinase